MQLVIRQAAAGGLPDVSFQGLNRLRFLAERGLLADLGPFLAQGGRPRRRAAGRRASSVWRRWPARRSG